VSELRPYQREDVDASWDALRRHGSTIYTAATGTGKSVVMASLARRAIAEGHRILVLSDRILLADQLQRIFEQWTGAEVGIEQGERSADQFLTGKPPTVIAMVQTLYSGAEGAERYRQWRPDEFGLVIVDEAEAFIAASFREPIEYFQNGGAWVWGCTATPMRGDGKSLGIIFEHALPPRDIRWAVNEGYLVPPRAADVAVELDTDLLRKNGDGDYSDASISRMLMRMAENEEEFRQFARGVLDINAGKRGILVAPKVDVARAISDYLCSEQPGASETIYGDLVHDEKSRLFDRHRAGEFPILSSVDMLTKGYDDPQVEQVFVCRPTRSRRLMIQIVGRALRLPDPAIGALPDADARREAIAASDKPYALAACLVPLDPDVRDMTVADALEGDMEPEVREKIRTRQNEQPDQDTLELLEACKAEVETERAEREKAARARILAQGKVSVHERDALSGQVGSVPISGGKTASGVSIKQVELLRKGGVPDNDIKGMSPGQAGRVIARIKRGWKEKLCTYKQAKALRRAGYGREELADMPIGEAGARLDALANAGWKIKREAIEERVGREAVTA